MVNPPEDNHGFLAFFGDFLGFGQSGNGPQVQYRTIYFTFDLARRLVREHVVTYDVGTTPGSGATPTTLTRTYTFDTRGNRLTMVVTGYENYTVTYSYNANNQLLTEVRTPTGTNGDNEYTNTFTYDNNGNQATRTTVHHATGFFGVIRRGH